MLVSGYSGIGKTSLIQELYKPIVRQRGLLHRRQVRSGRPQHPVWRVDAGVPRPRAAAPRPKARSAWRGGGRGSSDALGTNGGVLAEVIPEIELILGKQPPPPPLDPTEAQNRFGYVFQSFVGAARAEGPSARRVPRRSAVGRRRDARVCCMRC